ncbi:outer membrane protein assembly factor BamB family protein [Halobellus inordinatus]|uniref:outer membrane protein assembly factor BamB family protein n=1 Tax=Halobellus inordinatus TaxID=1126236 RepID=UPI002113FB4E|nr:PQQ-binding-like beta-propeller repeat protein [Halobellus ramosii]
MVSDVAGDVPADPSLRERAERAITRRRLLVAGGLGVGAGALTQLRTDPPAAPKVPEGTWPFTDRDAQRTDSAPEATPPAEPEIAWRKQPVPSVDALVVGPERVYVGSARTAGTAPAAAALDRADGTVRWTRQVPAQRLAFVARAVYATGESAPRSERDESGRSGTVTRLDATTGETQWQREVRDYGERLIVGERAVYVGYHGGVTAFGRNRGRRLFRTSTWGIPVTPLLADDALFLAGGRLTRFGARRWSEAVFEQPPDTVWERDPPNYTLDPTVVTRADAADLVATGRLSVSSVGGDSPSLRAHEVGEGTRRWATVDATPLSEPIAVKELAARGERLFHALRTGRDDGRRRAVFCRDATTGAERWRIEFKNWVRSVVVAGDRVLVGTRWDSVTPDLDSAVEETNAERSNADVETPPPGRVTALSLDGDVQWRQPIGGSVSAVVPVGSRILVGTDDASYGGRTAESGRVVTLD